LLPLDLGLGFFVDEVERLLPDFSFDD